MGVKFQGRVDYKAHMAAVAAGVARLRRMAPQDVFKPAVALLNRLRYPYKFGLIGLVATVSIGFFVVSLMVAMSSDLNAARDERSGLGVYPAAARVAQLVQQSMALTTGALNGEDALKQPALAKRDEIDAALQALATATQRADLGLAARVKALTSEWQQLRGKLDALQAKDAIGAYAKLNGQLIDFMRDLGEASKLISDTSPKSSYVADILIRKLPQLTDQIAQVQAYGEGLLVSRDLNADWKQAGVLFHGATRGKSDLVDALTRAARANPQGQAPIAAVQAAIAPGLDEFFELSDREVIKGAFTASVADLNAAAAHALDPLYAQADKALLPMLSATLDARIGRLSQQFWADMGVAAVIVLLLVYVSLGMFATILGSVSELSEGAARIGEGELSYRIRFSSRDELREVADQFNGMAESFTGVITGVKGTVQSLNDSAAALTASAARVSQGSVRQSEAASTMAAAIEEMTVGINEISRHAASADEVSQQTGQLSVEGGEVVQQTVAEMERIAEAVNQSAEVIKDLGRNSAKISSIVNSIKEIADQTNLLALNASIEAARAGDQGRGFAVVADEVRKLAERTTRATQEISGMVAGIQSGTNRAVGAMQDGVSRVRSGVELTQQAGDSMRRIRGESERVVQSVSDISLALREQTSASTEIAQNVERIAQMAEENGSVVADAAATAGQLETLARQLNAEISRFRL